MAQTVVDISHGGTGSATYVGDTLKQTVTQNSHGFSVGNAIALNGSGVYIKADATSSALCEFTGIVSAVADDNNFTQVLLGRITGLSSLTPGGIYFLTTTPGVLSLTPPVGLGNVQVPALRAVSSTVGYVERMRGTEILASTIINSTKRIIISNNASDATNDIDFASGLFNFDDGSGNAAMSNSTGQLDVVFGSGNGMLMTGTKANNTWYDLYAIWNPTTSTASPFAVVRGTSITLPSGYTKKAKVGTIVTDASGVIRPFTHTDRYFEFVNKVTDRNSSISLGNTTRNLLTVTCPSGMYGRFVGVGSATNRNELVNITSPASTDVATDSTNAIAGGDYNGYEILRRVDSSSRLAVRSSVAGYFVSINTVGWNDHEI